MNYEEFVETIEKDAEQYAKSCVCHRLHRRCNEGF